MAAAVKCGPVPVIRDWRSLPKKDLTRAERNMLFVEAHARVPEGPKVGQPLRLALFQEAFFYSVYDNPHGTRKAILSMARKNSKTATIAAIVLVHVVGPEARQNSRINSGARSRKQASEVYNYAAKMIRLSPTLSSPSVCRTVHSAKRIVGVPMNVEYEALSAEGKTVHGGSPIVAIVDEAGQIKGPHDDFYEGLTTGQGAYDDPLLIVISTQAPTDNDLFSVLIDDAVLAQEPNTVCHLYAAPDDCELDDEAAWKAANPAMGLFRSKEDIAEKAGDALRMPSSENSFRWLFLNQRIDASAPFVSKSVWQACGGEVVPSFDGLPVFAGLDLSSVADLTAFVAMAPVDGRWHVRPRFWLPEQGLREKAKSDRVPYDVWARDGFLNTTPGPSIDYRFVAAFLWDFAQENDVRKIAFDRWGWKHLKPLLAEAGFPEEQLEGDAAIFEPMGQGFASISPALLSLESILLNAKISHGGHPVLSMCMANATVKADPAGNRKLDKTKSYGRIDGAVALVMATAMAETYVKGDALDVFAMIA